MKLRALLILTIISSPTLAAEELFSLYQPSNAPTEPTTDSAIPFEVGQIQLNQDVAATLAVGQLVEVSLPFTGSASGEVVRDFSSNAENPKKIIRLSDGGGLELHYSNQSISSITIIPADGSRYYQTNLDFSGQGSVISEDLNNLRCLEYPAPPRLLSQVPETTGQTLDLPLAELKTLQSNPGASNVVFLNFWGGIESGTGWTDYYNGGLDIIYAPYDTDGDDQNFSLTERNAIWLAWAEASEDYSAFDVNITTDLSVYNNTPIANRALNAITPTNDIFPNYGGVAFVGVFSRTTDYAKTSWTWNLYPSSMGQTISHEVGHQMGLSHDGNSTATYSSGHGTWGPVMGAPFGKTHVQFSKGEYPDANEFEDDLTIIGNVIGNKVDEAGDTIGTASTLTGASNKLLGTISPEGLSGNDVDIFTFNLPTTSQVELDLRPWITDSTDTNTYGTNVSIQASLEDSLGTVIATIGPNSNPLLNYLYHSGDLNAGDYFIRIDSVSYDASWSTGFGEYGHGGRYKLSLEIETDSSLSEVNLVSPVGITYDSNPAFIWQAEPNATSYVFRIKDLLEQAYIFVQTIDASTYCDAGSCQIQPNDLNLQIEGRYSWWVKAVNDNEASDWSATTIRVADPAPNTVTLLAPENETSEQSPTFVWEPQNYATNYRVQVYDRVLQTTVHLADHTSANACSATTCTMNDSSISLSLGKNHFWRVRAQGSGGWSAWSDRQVFSVLPEAPGLVTMISPTGTIDSFTPDFTWQNLPEASLYRVQIYDKTAGSTVWLQDHTPSSVCSNGSCNLSSPVSLNLGVNHFWRVRAYNESGWGEWNERLRFSILQD